MDCIYSLDFFWPVHSGRELWEAERKTIWDFIFWAAPPTFSLGTQYFLGRLFSRRASGRTLHFLPWWLSMYFSGPSKNFSGKQQAWIEFWEAKGPLSAHRARVNSSRRAQEPPSAGGGDSGPHHGGGR